ncbi:DUF551 domain-containing protein [Serratia marcescens]|nr:DUF551 domain-containing protein [Serratia marcescens]
MTLTTTEELKHLASSDNTNELTRRLARECLANREAQPVAWRHDDGPFAGIAITRAKSVADSWIAKGWTVTPLYTAPPAPAVPKEMTVEQAYENVQTWHYANGWNACRAAMLAQPVSQSYTLNSPEIPDGWVACTERMPELDKRVLLYFGSYDGHIEDGCIGDDGDGPYHYFFDGDSLQQEPTHWMPLPAAPEGGN